MERTTHFINPSGEKYNACGTGPGGIMKRIKILRGRESEDGEDDRES
jgi:hypothetical protein